MINKDMAIEEVMRKYPETRTTFERHGLGCAGCPAALFESIEQGADVHGVEVELLVADLNDEAMGINADRERGQ
jgi:hybrid cluster-associated redox disulfide protein